MKQDIARVTAAGIEQGITGYGLPGWSQGVVAVLVEDAIDQALAEQQAELTQLRAERLLLAKALVRQSMSLDDRRAAKELAKRIVEGGATETCCNCGKQFPKHEMMNNKPICRECY